MRAVARLQRWWRQWKAQRKHAEHCVSVLQARWRGLLGRQEACDRKRFLERRQRWLSAAASSDVASLQAVTPAALTEPESQTLLSYHQPSSQRSLERRPIQPSGANPLGAHPVVVSGIDRETGSSKTVAAVRWRPRSAAARHVRRCESGRGVGGGGEKEGLRKDGGGDAEPLDPVQIHRDGSSSCQSERVNRRCHSQPAAATQAVHEDHCAAVGVQDGSETELANVVDRSALLEDFKSALRLPLQTLRAQRLDEVILESPAPSER